MHELGIYKNGTIRFIDLDFLDFLQLENRARFVLTDSEGVQKETCILGVPYVTLRGIIQKDPILLWQDLIS